MFSHHQKLILSLLCFLVITNQYSFSHFASIPITTTGSVQDITISDDDEYILATDNDAFMLFLKNNGSGWSVTQNFSQAGGTTVNEPDISSYHEWAVFSSTNGNVYVFKYYDSNSSFDLHQTLNPASSSNINDVDITDDFQTIICSNNNSETFIYKFDGADFILNETLAVQATQVKMCDDQSFFVYTTTQKVAIYSESGGTYSYSYDIIDTYTAGQSFVIELNADCNYLGVYSGTSSEIYMYDGTNFTSIDTRNAIFGNPSISDYGEIAVVLQMVSNGVVIQKATDNSGYSSLGTLTNTSFTRQNALGGNYIITLYSGFGINVFEVTGHRIKFPIPDTNTNNTSEAEATEGNWIIIGSVVGGVIVLSALITGAIVYFKGAPQVSPTQNMAEGVQNDKVEIKPRESVQIEEYGQINNETSVSTFPKTLGGTT